MRGRGLLIGAIGRGWISWAATIVAFVSASLLQGCMTPARSAPDKVVPPSILLDAPPEGDFQMRLLDFLNQRQGEQMSCAPMLLLVMSS